MEVPGSTPTDSTPREAEHAPGNGQWKKPRFRTSACRWRAPDHQASATPIKWRRSYPRFSLVPGATPIEWRRGLRRLWSPCQAPHCSERECGPGAHPRAVTAAQAAPSRRTTPGRGYNRYSSRRPRDPSAARARQPNESPSGDRSPNHARRTRRQGAAGAAGAAQKADHTSLGVYLASQARASGNPINSSSSAKSAISPATSRVVPCSFKALSVFWIERMQPRISECG